MVADIRKRVEEAPFRPFLIRMADGREYPVPTVDHVWLLPVGGRVMVQDDDGVAANLPALLISGVVDWQPKTSRRRGPGSGGRKAA